MNHQRIYACIDLKSFYASVECVSRQLDPATTNLVVADASRGSGAITLAITPAMKKRGIKNRCRLFEIPSALDYIIAPPRMQLYMEYSANIYGIYLKFFAPEDIYIYSIDECFINLSPYLKMYKLTPMELVQKVIAQVKSITGISATAGVGTNLFQAKVALDITAKHSPTNVGYVDETNFDQLIAQHRPITDIWGIGAATAKKLASYGVKDLKALRALPIPILKKNFGGNYKILLDHAQGLEPTTLAEIKKYQPQDNSISTSQILMKDYHYKEAWQIMTEMLEVLTLELFNKNISTNHLALHIRYSKDIFPPKQISRKLSHHTHSYKYMESKLKEMYFQNVADYPIRQIGLSLGGIKSQTVEALNLFAAPGELKEEQMYKTLLELRQRFGKNIIFKAHNLLAHSTALERNNLIGGHHA